MDMKTPTAVRLSALERHDDFLARHIGTTASAQDAMLREIGFASRVALMNAIVPAAIRMSEPLALPEPISETEALARLRDIASRNRVLKSFIGQGYYGTHMPGVIQRNVFENPAWYTAYTPYQPEISQGRLEALLNFQTMVCDLTGMAIANASMLDEATAAAEAMTLCQRVAAVEVAVGSSSPTMCSRRRSTSCARARRRSDSKSSSARPPKRQRAARSRRCCNIRAPTATFAMIARSLQRRMRTERSSSSRPTCWRSRCSRRRASGAPTSSSVRRSASACRWAIGGPHAAFMATRDAYKRALPGRLVGVTVDARGSPAYRLALQTREQHIRREKATSNICTAQVLLAVIASMYAVYHGAEGLAMIARRVHRLTAILKEGLARLGIDVATPIVLRYADDRHRRRDGGRSCHARSRPAATCDGATTDRSESRSTRRARARTLRCSGACSPDTTLRSTSTRSTPSSTTRIRPDSRAHRRFSRIRSFAGTVRRRRCSATCAVSPTVTWRWTAR